MAFFLAVMTVLTSLQDLSKGLAMAEQLDAGMIRLNRGLLSDPAAPLGGTRQSGIRQTVLFVLEIFQQ